MNADAPRHIALATARRAAFASARRGKPHLAVGLSDRERERLSVAATVVAEIERLEREAAALRRWLERMDAR